MHLVYIDDSGDEEIGVFTALAVPVTEWRNNFDAARLFRRQIRQSDGIYIFKELHAWEFVAGRGRIADRVVTKGRRCQIFKDALAMVAALKGVQIINAVYPKKSLVRAKKVSERYAFERLLNRLNTLMTKLTATRYSSVMKATTRPIPASPASWACSTRFPADTVNGKAMGRVPRTCRSIESSKTRYLRTLRNPILSNSPISVPTRCCVGSDRWHPNRHTVSMSPS